MAFAETFFHWDMVSLGHHMYLHGKIYRNQQETIMQTQTKTEEKKRSILAAQFGVET